MTSRVLLGLVLAVGCTRRNPEYCDTQADCAAGMFCDVAVHTCRPGDASVDTSDASPDAAPGPRCSGLALTCGTDSQDNCCATAMTLPGGTYYRGNDVAADGMFMLQAQATVSAFVLDKYEVTVGRFRQFIELGFGTQELPPTDGSGNHPNLAGSGWKIAWNASLTSNAGALRTALKCESGRHTWTDNAGANENLPINCVTWYEAMAFCIWDGGYLPTEAEWHFAASAGAEQRAYAWSSPAGSTAIDCTHANYNPGSHCVSGGAARRVGSNVQGEGEWGHADLAGNVAELVLDTHATSYPACTGASSDCADVSSGTFKSLRGGAFPNTADNVRSAFRDYATPAQRQSTVGFRCARMP